MFKAETPRCLQEKIVVHFPFEFTPIMIGLRNIGYEQIIVMMSSSLLGKNKLSLFFPVQWVYQEQNMLHYGNVIYVYSAQVGAALKVISLSSDPCL